MVSTLTELAIQLISCPSVTPHDAGCQAILQERLQALGFHCEPMRFGEVDNLWARLGNQEPLVVFAGHTDVVPAGPESAWLSPPFQPEIRQGHLYGRGAADMKSAIAAMMIAIENYLQKHPAFPGSFAFLITSDEEGPAIHGTQQVMQVLAARQEKIHYCIVGEASSEKKLGDQIRIGRRGSLHGKLTITGKQGHVAIPELAKNPIHHCLAALRELTTTSWDQGNENFPATGFQISNIHSGTGATNVIPGSVEILFNLRFSTVVTPEALQQRIEAILQKQELSFSLEWQVTAFPFLTRKGKLIHAAQQAISEITQHTPTLSTAGGTSDGRFIAPTGAEVIELGVCYASIHHANENVNLADLELLARCYERIIELLFS